MSHQHPPQGRAIQLTAILAARMSLSAVLALSGLGPSAGDSRLKIATPEAPKQSMAGSGSHDARGPEQPQDDSSELPMASECGGEAFRPLPSVKFPPADTDPAAFTPSFRVAVTLSDKGRVIRLRAITSTGSKSVDSDILKTLRRWRFCKRDHGKTVELAVRLDPGRGGPR